MANAEQLKSIVHDVTPHLEKVLATDSETSHIPENLQRRLTQCGLATAALQGYLLEEHGIETERSIITLHNAPKDEEFRSLTHVVLQDATYMIDPTHGQFMRFVGLTPKIAAAHNMEHLYPAKPALVVPKEKLGELSDKYARHAHQLDQSGAIPKQLIEYAPDGKLRGTPLTEKQRVYEEIWDLSKYESFPVESQPPAFQDAAKRATESLIRLARQKR